MFVGGVVNNARRASISARKQLRVVDLFEIDTTTRTVPGEPTLLDRNYRRRDSSQPYGLEFVVPNARFHSAVPG